MSSWQAGENRYDDMTYNRCGRSGLDLPALSLGLWHNFGAVADFDMATAMVRRAFDLGITHFDLANNYGPPPGSAEDSFGKILANDLASHRDELIISSKAGWDMWPGPYGDLGSRKYLVASLDQSLQRMGLDYVDIYYHHRPDPKTPLEETMGALDHIVRQGKALYVGISSVPVARSRSKRMWAPCQRSTSRTRNCKASTAFSPTRDKFHEGWTQRAQLRRTAICRESTSVSSASNSAPTATKIPGRRPSTTPMTRAAISTMALATAALWIRCVVPRATRVPE